MEIAPDRQFRLTRDAYTGMETPKPSPQEFWRSTDAVLDKMSPQWLFQPTSFDEQLALFYDPFKLSGVLAEPVLLKSKLLTRLGVPSADFQAKIARLNNGPS